jgi:hypothetical protein
MDLSMMGAKLWRFGEPAIGAFLIALVWGVVGRSVNWWVGAAAFALLAGIEILWPAQTAYEAAEEDPVMSSAVLYQSAGSDMKPLDH